MTNSEKYNAVNYINLYKKNLKNWNETTCIKMQELELLLTQSDIDYIKSVLGEYCFA